MRDITFEQWQWEEELTVFTLEEVGLGKVCELDLVQHFSNDLSLHFYNQNEINSEDNTK